MVNFVNSKYLLPAEWEPHQAIWLAWPHDTITFPTSLNKVRTDVVKIISAIHQSEQVELLVLDDAMQKQASDKLQIAGIDLSKITFRQTDYMDGWMRDCSGLTVKDETGKPSLINFIFNIWGNKFPDLEIDKQIAEKVSTWVGISKIDLPIVLEGGAIDVNGSGVLLTTEQCLLNINRNPGKTKEELEKYFAEYLGVKKTIWLKKGLFNDHTDGHIDDIARFASANTILCAFEENPEDENYQSLKDNFEQLSKETDAFGKPFQIIKLPMPHFSYEVEAAGTHSKKAPASYTNFYIGNTVVLVPVYNDPSDTKALEIIQKCFPNKKVVGIECRDLLYGGGAVHCLTMQQPAN